jgi:hypothetical protein
MQVAVHQRVNELEAGGVSFRWSPEVHSDQLWSLDGARPITARRRRWLIQVEAYRRQTFLKTSPFVSAASRAVAESVGGTYEAP